MDKGQQFLFQIKNLGCALVADIHPIGKILTHTDFGRRNQLFP